MMCVRDPSVAQPHFCTGSCTEGWLLLIQQCSVFLLVKKLDNLLRMVNVFIGNFLVLAFFIFSWGRMTAAFTGVGYHKVVVMELSVIPFLKPFQREESNLLFFFQAGDDPGNFSAGDDRQSIGDFVQPDCVNFLGRRIKRCGLEKQCNSIF